MQHSTIAATLKIHGKRSFLKKFIDKVIKTLWFQKATAGKVLSPRSTAQGQSPTLPTRLMYGQGASEALPAAQKTETRPGCFPKHG